MSRFKSFLAGATILLGSIGMAVFLVKSKKRPARTQASEMVQLVEYAAVAPQTHSAKTSGFGTTIPARESQLKSEVAGRVVRLSSKFRPGGRFTKGQLLLNIDPRDYQIAVQQQQASVGRAELDLQLEKGRKRVAEREFKLLSSGATSEARTALILREPQLATTQLALEAAKSGLERAELNLERTQLRAPFNGFLRNKSTDVGEMIGPAAPLGTFVGTDAFWVKVTLPIEAAKLVGIFDSAIDAKAHIISRHSDRHSRRSAAVLEWTGELDPLSKTVQVLVEIEDPLGLNADTQEPLLLGSLVEVEFEGPQTQNIVRVPRAALREGTQIFAIDDQDRLIIRDANIAWSNRDYVFLTDHNEEFTKVVLGKVQLAVEGAKLKPIEQGLRNPSSARAETVVEEDVQVPNSRPVDAKTPITTAQ